MKNNENIIKDFKAVKFMREVRDRISNDIKDMTFEEIKKYFEERRKRAGRHQPRAPASEARESPAGRGFSPKGPMR